MQLNSDNRLFVATGRRPRHQHLRPTPPARRERNTTSSVERATRTLHTTLHHPRPSPVGNRTNGHGAKRPQRIAPPARVIARRQSTFTINTFPGSETGREQNNHLSCREYTEDAPTVEQNGGRKGIGATEAGFPRRFLDPSYLRTFLSRTGMAATL